MPTSQDLVRTPPASAPTRPAAAHFLDCLARAVHVREPYDYWLLDDVLPGAVIDAIAALPVPPPQDCVFNGRRESNNSTRVYFSPENRAKFSVCQDVAEVFADPVVVAALEKATRTDLSKGHLRIEYCQDVDGFWLEPHCDIAVKLFTMLIYLSDDPNLADAGTDVYDATPEHRLVASAPYEKNKGMIFIPGLDTWHGFSKRPIRGLRKSVIVNYVSSDWKSQEELAFP
jgi:hypothetical protein